MNNLCHLPGVALATLVLVHAAVADVYVSNLDGASAGAGSVHAGAWRAAQFTTDASAAAYSLDSVTLTVSSSPLPGGTFFVALYSDAGSAPGAPIGANLTGNADPSPGNVTYTATGQSLAANTSYWVVAGVVGSSIYFVSLTNDAASGSWSLPARMVSFDGGTVWNPSANPPFEKLAIAATPVPEPAAYALLAGLGALGLARRRRTK